MADPSTAVTRLGDRQSFERDRLDALLQSTPLATVAFVRDGQPVALPIGFALVGDELVIHGSTGSPWLRLLATGVPAAVSVSALDAVMVARSGFESSFRYRSALVFGSFRAVPKPDKDRYLQALTDSFIPGRSAELRASTDRELSATLVLALTIGAGNWSLKINAGWPEDDEQDVAAGGWAGVVPLTMGYDEPLPAPDCGPDIAVPESVQALIGRTAGGS